MFTINFPHPLIISYHVTDNPYLLFGIYRYLPSYTKGFDLLPANIIKNVLRIEGGIRIFGILFLGFY